MNAGKNSVVNSNRVKSRPYNPFKYGYKLYNRSDLGLIRSLKSKVSFNKIVGGAKKQKLNYTMDDLSEQYSFEVRDGADQSRSQWLDD